MNNKWINSFLTIVQEGSINSAARVLFISPQALLQQINLMEEEVGVSLFQRSKTGMELTMAGKEFLAGAQQLETVYAKTVSRCRLANAAENTIRIPMMSSIILPKFLELTCARYMEGNPPHRIEIKTAEYGTWMDGLRNLEYDIIEHYALDGQCPKGIHFEYLSDEPSWCITSAYHPFSDKKKILPEDLEGQTILSPETSTALMAYLKIYLDTHDIHTKIENITNDRYTILDGIMNGGIYMGNYEIAMIFVGCAAVPLDFDNHVKHGLACREEMYETYEPFFEIAHQVYREQTDVRR